MNTEESEIITQNIVTNLSNVQNVAAGALHDLKAQAISAIQSQQTGESVSFVIHSLRVLFETIDELLPLFKKYEWSDQTTVAFVLRYVVTERITNIDAWNRLPLTDDDRQKVVILMQNCCVSWGRLQDHFSTLFSLVYDLMGQWTALLFGI